MQIKKSELARLFKKLDLRVRSTKHRYGWLCYRGKKILRVHYSHGKGELPGRISNKVRSQLKLPESEFKKLLHCPLSLEDYLAILKKKGAHRKWGLT